MTNHLPAPARHRDAVLTSEEWKRLDHVTIAAYCDAIRRSRPVPPTLLAVVLGANTPSLPSDDPRRRSDLTLDDDPDAEVKSLMRNELAESMVHARRRRMTSRPHAGSGAARTAPSW